MQEKRYVKMKVTRNNMGPIDILLLQRSCQPKSSQMNQQPPVLPSHSTNLTDCEGELSLIGGPCRVRMDSRSWFLNELSAVPGRDEGAPIMIEGDPVPAREAWCGYVKVTPGSLVVAGLPFRTSTTSVASLEFLQKEPRQRGRCLVCAVSG